MPLPEKCDPLGCLDVESSRRQSHRLLPLRHVVPPRADRRRRPAAERPSARQRLGFQVRATGDGSQQKLTITTRGGKRPIKAITQTIDGHVVGAEVADLNSNSLPEITVYVQSAGSGSYGQLVAYSVINGTQLSPIYLQELTGGPAKGYQGHDEFRVVEGCLVRHRQPAPDLLQAPQWRSQLDSPAHFRAAVLIGNANLRPPHLR